MVRPCLLVVLLYHGGSRVLVMDVYWWCLLNVHRWCLCINGAGVMVVLVNGTFLPWWYIDGARWWCLCINGADVMVMLTCWLFIDGAFSWCFNILVFHVYQWFLCVGDGYWWCLCTGGAHVIVVPMCWRYSIIGWPVYCRWCWCFDVRMFCACVIWC